MKLDPKFYGSVLRAMDNSAVPEDQYMVFLAGDNAFPETLQFYRDKCAAVGTDPELLAAIDRSIDRLTEWRARNADKLHVPNANGERLLA